jgi:hypothetical protein
MISPWVVADTCPADFSHCSSYQWLKYVSKKPAVTGFSFSDKLKQLLQCAARRIMRLCSQRPRTISLPPHPWSLVAPAVTRQNQGTNHQPTPRRQGRAGRWQSWHLHRQCLGGTCVVSPPARCVQSLMRNARSTPSCSMNRD